MSQAKGHSLSLGLPERDRFTAEQIADRWGSDLDYVQHLIFTHQLARAFLISGPARILVPTSSGEFELHPDTARTATQTQLLVSANHSVPSTCSWPLSYVCAVYEFLLHGRPNHSALEAYCSDSRTRKLGWTIEFCGRTTKVLGEESYLVALEDLRAFEALHDLVPKTVEEQHKSQHLRDTRTQRCRAVAQLLWERDLKATVPDIYRHEWIQRIACEGRPPVEETFRRWVKDLNPNRNPGRRPS